MRKVFISLAIYFSIVLVLITTVGFIKPKPQFNYVSASYIRPWCKKSTPLNSSNGYGPTTQVKNGSTTSDEKYTSGEEEIYFKLDKLIKEMFKTSAIENIYHAAKFSPAVSEDYNKEYPTLKTATNLSAYYAIELRYNTQQSQIVQNQNGSTHKITYYSLMILLDVNKAKGYQQVAIYFVDNNSSPSVGSYSSGDKVPMLAWANTSKLVKYLQQLAK